MTIESVEDWVSGMIAHIDGPGRRQIARVLAKELRASQQDRIKRQQDPDGAAFAPRKPQHKLRGKAGRIKTGPMFTKLRLAKRLKIITATQDEIGVGFNGRDAAIAAVHQDGGSDHVAGPKSKTVRYAMRRLLGFTQADRDRLMDSLIEWLKSA